MQRHLYEHLNGPDHSGFVNDVSLHLLIKQTQRILLNNKITGFTHLKLKYHCDLMLKIVCRKYLFNLLHYVYGKTVFGL